MTATAKKSFVHRIMLGWEAQFIRYPWLVILGFVLAAGFTLRYTMDHLKVNTNTADMISLEVPFQRNRLALESAFPQDIGTGLLLVEGQTPEATSQAVKTLVNRIKQDSEHFQSVDVPDGGPFFEKNGLLYVGLEDLEDLSTQLANAQPFIGRLTRDNSLRGLLGILGDALDDAGKSDLKLDLDPLLDEVRISINEALKGHPYQVSWRRLMTPGAQGFGVTQRFVVIRPILHYEEVMPAESAIKALDHIIQDTLAQDTEGLRIRKTGEFILEHEEMETISNGVSIASLASLALVCLTLWVAYGSLKLVFATFVSLTLGLIFSLGFATVTIGQLNLISIGFAVLFIGMGDAYSSHFCLRYRELVLEGASTREALQKTLTSTGPALVLSALTAAIGLFSFIPTSYSGVAELGIIAGASMFIALFTTFTVLPALMKILPLKPPKKRKMEAQGSGRWTNGPLIYAKAIRRITIALGLAAIVLVFKVEVDFNPLNLRDPHTESVQTFKALLQSEDTSPMTLAALATSPEEAQRLQAAFKALPTVNAARTLFDLVPADQDEKLTMLGDLETLMGASLRQFPQPHSGLATLDLVDAFDQKVLRRLADEPDQRSLVELALAIETLKARLQTEEAEDQQKLLETIEASLLNPLPEVIHDLAQSLTAEAITLDTLPQELKARWLSPNGLYRVQITPKKDLGVLANLREFILEAQRVDPNVTDLPVTYLESMNEVIKAFQEAFGIAFVATTLILLLVLRNLKDTLLVLLPLLLASLLTAAMTVVLGIPFNFANIIALPLLFGLGVDSGIHMAHRLHDIERTQANLLESSEAKGVFYGALTTIFSFSSLALTPHQGTASMGLLLAIGLLLTLLAALVILPAFSGLKAPKGADGVKS